MTSDFISFDDFLDEEPATSTSIKRDKKPILAPATYKGPDARDTRANWESPGPEEVVLFWSITKCTTCKKTFEHPTYYQNSILVKYRVSKYRAVLRPYCPAIAEHVTSLPHVRCITKSNISQCSKCFNTLVSYTDEEWEAYLDKNSPPAPETFDTVPCTKPLADITYTDQELLQQMTGK